MQEPPTNQDKTNATADEQSVSLQWPTLIVFALAYAFWLLLTALHMHIPNLLLVPTLVFLVALHSSLQHEVIHGHPTTSAKFNNAMAFPALGLLVPFERYELLHLQHHRNWLLTDPLDDSESYFLTREQWLKCHPNIKLVLKCNNTLLGRLLVGPAVMVVRMLHSEFELFKISSDVRSSWLKHLIGICLVLAWLSLFDFSILIYSFAVAYPAASLLMLRAYSEHLPEENLEYRSAIIKTNAIMQLLYLNNNYHRVHHDHPDEPWYLLPRLYRKYYSQHNMHVYPGYLHLFKRFGFKQRYPVDHPFLPE